MAWALNVELTRRGIPPALRRSALIPSASTDQIELAADLQWMVEKHREFIPHRKRAWRIFRVAPSGDWWLTPEEPLPNCNERRCWGQTVYALLRDKRSDNYKIQCALDLSEDMRRQSLTLPNKAQYTARRVLTEKIGTIRDELLAHALNKPDKAGRHRADDVINRNILAFCTHIKTHGNMQESLQYLRDVHGQNIPRQRFSDRVDWCVSNSDAANSVVTLLKPPRAKHQPTA